MMDYETYQPEGLLGRYVKFIWSMDLRPTPGETTTQRVVPDGCVCLQLHLGSRPRVLQPNGERVIQPWAYVAGQQTSFTDLEVHGPMGLLAVVLRPEASAALLGLPTNELRGQRVEMAQILGPESECLHEQMEQTQGHRARFELIETFLTAGLSRDVPPVDPRMLSFVQRVSSSGGGLRVHELARGLQLSRRQLERNVAATLGMSPKAFSRVVRYQRVLALKQCNPALGLTQLAYQSGYADQAHFNREFRAITGYTPGQAFELCPAHSDYYSFA